MVVYFWIFFVFLVGIAIGSFLNVCVARLPVEKSLLWPGSRCGKCFQAIAWYDNLPLLSYLLLRGRCRQCGATYSIRYFLVELLTGLGFVGLFYLEVVVNIHDWPTNQEWQIRFGFYPWQWWMGFGFHAILFSLLMAAAFCDLDGRQIPLQLTLTGTLIGLIGAVLFPWPWPWTGEEALQPIRAYQASAFPSVSHEIPWWQFKEGIGPREGLYPWPVWGPLPSWLEPGTWQTGLVTGLAGALVGTLMLRGIAFLFSTGLGKEALGLGDADLMMMAGAFLGWQLVVVAFFVSVVPALFVGVFQILARNDSSMPFGPSLAMGVIITFLCWKWIGPRVQILFFFWEFMLALIILGGGFMLGASFLLRKKNQTAGG
jgi:leader peptidase (prepilin peptidase)/N-methyltransferase